MPTVKFSKDGPVTFGAIGGDYPQMNARAGDFAVVSGIVKDGVLGPATGDIVRPDNAASITITLAGVKYTAESGVLGEPYHLVGPVVNEYHKAVALTNHLTARFVIRKYVGFDMPRVDITVENDWAFEPGPQNFTYDFEISIAGKVIYSQAALTHYHHARWRMVFNDYGVVASSPWLGTNAVPNYDPEFPPNEALLARLGGVVNAPMAIGAALPYMPTTGAHDDIGILPAWQSAYVLSMDERARNATLATADGAGTWSMHYRDKVTDRPVTLTDHPRMTIAGRKTDAGYDAFPDYAGDTTTPYTPDIPHQPSLAYLPYLVTGDYYYLEEMQFWAMFDAFSSNPNYRDGASGLMIPEQLRGQAWGLRTIFQAAYATPDDHPLKAECVRIANSNIDWYNTNYALNPTANTLGVMTHYYSMHYDEGTQVASWMDDFFTSVFGHAVDLGFETARPMLLWKAQFPVGRMVAPGVCWLNGAPYDYKVRDTATSPIYATFAEAYIATFGAEKAAAACPTVGDMGNIADGYMGYPSNMQPALAYAVDAGAPGADEAWKLFMGRTVKPDYRLGAQFSTKPRKIDTTQPIPEEPIMTYKITIEDFDSAPQQLAPGSESSLTSIRIRIISPDGTTVLGKSDTLPYSLGGLDAGIYSAEIAALDSTGAVMGTPATKVIDTTDAPVVVPPEPVTASLPSAIKTSVVQEV